MGVSLTDGLAIGQAETKLLLQHYATAGPIIERLFGAIPFAWTTLPKGAGSPAFFHGPLADRTKPKAPVVEVRTAGGTHRYAQLSADRISGLVRHGAVEILSWSPRRGDP